MNNSKKQYHVVFQLSSDDTLIHKSLIKQLDNLTAAMQGIEIEVVAHGPGISMLFKESAYAKDIERMRTNGIVFMVCRNTLKVKKIDDSRLLPAAQVIPAGLAHIIQRQSEGWAYIKAGF